jgi:hypothetical protein
VTKQELTDFIANRVQYDSDGGRLVYRCEKCGHEKRSPESHWYYHYDSLASEIVAFMGLGPSFHEKIIEAIQACHPSGNSAEDAKAIVHEILP